MEPFVDKMNNMLDVLPYLGSTKYMPLLEMSKKYHEAMNPKFKFTDSGSPDESNNT